MKNIKCQWCKHYTVLIKTQCGYCRKEKRDIHVASMNRDCENYKSRGEK